MATTAISIGGRINTACRKEHTELNRLLMDRLPLALPPNQDTPRLFGRGLVPFANIIIFFEEEWDLLERTAPSTSVRLWLKHLRPPGLARTMRFKNDLVVLRGGTNTRMTPYLMDKWSRDHNRWTKKERERIRRNPHILVAYAWVFYMATFSGGRWIREQLANSGEDFWTFSTSKTIQTNSPLEFPGYTFLSFDGDHDGEEIKAQFKERLAGGETILTEKEKEEIVEVGRQLFEKCIKLVGELDQMDVKENTGSWLSWMAPILLVVLLYLLYLVGSRPPYQ